MSSTGTLLRFLLLAAFAILAVAASLLHGSSGISLRDAFAALAGGGDEMTRSIVLDVRLPRTLAAIGVGSVLALVEPACNTVAYHFHEKLWARRSSRNGRVAAGTSPGHA